MEIEQCLGENGAICATDWGLYDSKILDIIQGVLILDIQQAPHHTHFLKMIWYGTIRV